MFIIWGHHVTHEQALMIILTRFHIVYRISTTTFNHQFLFIQSKYRDVSTRLYIAIFAWTSTFSKSRLGLISRKCVSICLSCSEYFVSSYATFVLPRENINILVHDSPMSLASAYLSSACSRKICLSRLLRMELLLESYFPWAFRIDGLECHFCNASLRQVIPLASRWENCATP